MLVLSLCAIAPLTELTRPSTTPTRSQQNNKAAQAAEPAVAPAAPRAACARRGESAFTSSRLSSLPLFLSLLRPPLSLSLSLTHSRRCRNTSSPPLQLSLSPLFQLLSMFFLPRGADDSINHFYSFIFIFKPRPRPSLLLILHFTFQVLISHNLLAWHTEQWEGLERRES